jgi:murein DD-endopeptidase MepM/ murein hydrolase activator NlpD
MSRFLSSVCLILCVILFAACASESRRSSEAPSSVPRPSQLDYLDFDWPLKSFNIGQVYGWRTKRRMHEGLDLGAPRGTPVFAAEAGRVLYVGDRLKGFGNMVILDHGDNWTTVYAHLLKSTIRQGTEVVKGESIGLVGRTGRASGYHLHFEVRKGADPMDPLLFLPAAPEVR